MILLSCGIIGYMVNTNCHFIKLSHAYNWSRRGIDRENAHQQLLRNIYERHTTLIDGGDYDGVVWYSHRQSTHTIAKYMDVCTPPHSTVCPHSLSESCCCCFFFVSSLFFWASPSQNITFNMYNIVCIWIWRNVHIVIQLQTRTRPIQTRHRHLLFHYYCYYHYMWNVDDRIWVIAFFLHHSAGKIALIFVRWSAAAAAAARPLTMHEYIYLYLYLSAIIIIIMDSMREMGCGNQQTLTMSTLYSCLKF